MLDYALELFGWSEGFGEAADFLVELVGGLVAVDADSHILY